MTWAPVACCCMETFQKGLTKYKGLWSKINFKGQEMFAANRWALTFQGTTRPCHPGRSRWDHGHPTISGICCHFVLLEAVSPPKNTVARLKSNYLSPSKKIWVGYAALLPVTFMMENYFLRYIRICLLHEETLHVCSLCRLREDCKNKCYYGVTIVKFVTKGWTWFVLKVNMLVADGLSFSQRSTNAKGISLADRKNM